MGVEGRRREEGREDLEIATVVAMDYSKNYGVNEEVSDLEKGGPTYNFR